MLTKYGDVGESLGLSLEGLDFHKFGRNPASATSTDEVVWTRGGTSYPWPASALATTIVSSSANDADSGSGCKTVKVFGLDADYKETSEDVIMDGTSAVTLVNKYLRVYRAYNSSSQDAVGTISVKHGSTVLAEILGSRNQTEMCVYTVPVGKTLHLTSALFAAEGNKEVSYSLWARSYGGVFRIQQSFAAYGQGMPIPYNPSLVYSAKTDIFVKGNNKGSNDIVVAELYGALLS